MRPPKQNPTVKMRVREPPSGERSQATAAATSRCTPVGRCLRDVLHEGELVVALVDAGGAPEVVDRDRRVAALGEAQRELLVEAVEAADVGQDHDADAGRLVRRRGERGEAVVVRGVQHEVLVGDRGAGDHGDRRRRVKVVAHRSLLLGGGPARHRSRGASVALVPLLPALADPGDAPAVAFPDGALSYAQLAAAAAELQGRLPAAGPARAVGDGADARPRSAWSRRWAPGWTSSR